MEDVGVPIPREGVQIAGDEPPQVIGAPGDDPAVEERVAQVPGDGCREPGRQRPRQRDGTRPVQRNRGERAAPSPAGCASIPGDGGRGPAHYASSLGQLVEDHLQHRRGRHGQQRADDAEQRSADQQRDDDRDRADADLPLHQLRHEQVVLELLLREEEHADAERHARRDGERHDQRGDGGEDWPDHRDELADAGNQAEHEEIRHAEQPQADRGCRADDGAEQQLAPEPRAHLDGDVARHRGDPKPLLDREQAHEPPEDRIRLHEHVEGQDQDRDDPEDAAGQAEDRAEHGRHRVTAGAQHARRAPSAAPRTS